MIVDYVVADPAGNITVFVLNDVPKAQYHSIARQFLENPELQAEQVGFVKPAILGGKARLEMMGGEFCGNAARSFGLLCGKGEQAVTIEITGSGKPLLVTLEGTDASVEMPLPKATAELDGFPVMIFEGIVHIIVPDRSPDSILVEKLLKEAEVQFQPEATGVLFVKGQKMIPIVYVKQTDSLVWEHSCGSGTFALACYQALKKGEGRHTFQVHQPGGLITTQVCVQAGKVTQGSIGGPVFLSETLQMELS